MRGRRRDWSALQGQMQETGYLHPRKLKKSVRFKGTTFLPMGWTLLGVGTRCPWYHQHAQQTVGKHDWWQAGHPLKTALENPSGSRQYVAVPCSWTPTLPPVGDDTWSMVLFPDDLNKFSPKHKIGHLCASLSTEEKHLDWSEQKDFDFLNINYQLSLIFVY